MKNFIIKSVLLLFFFLILTACEEEKHSITSDQFTITVQSINQSDIDDNGSIDKDENISNGTGNPWGEFIKKAESEIGTPKSFEIVSASLQLVNTEGVNFFEDFATDYVAARFLSNQGNDVSAVKVELGKNLSPQGLTVELTDLASQSDLNVLIDRLVKGDFHVGFVCNTNLTKDESFSFDVKINFVVKAHD